MLNNKGLKSKDRVVRCLLLAAVCMFTLHITANDRIRIWEGTRVKAQSVTLDPYLPNGKGTKTAIIICPGGSYCWHDYKNEGKEVAKWLRDNGIAAFILKYRVQGMFQYVTHSRLLFGGNQHPDMISDVQRAIQYVRENAEQYGVEKIGVMGFSAGGHLAMSSAVFASTDFLAKYGISTSVSLRPDFVAPIYPVVSFSHPDSHKRSRRALLGERRKSDTVLRDSLSLERHVPEDCPPVFLMNCKDDPVVKYHNSEMLDSALTIKNIPHKYIQYKTGRHGFGASKKKGSKECRQWKSEFLRWLKEVHIQ